MRKTLLALSLLVPTLSSAAVYQCTVDGHTVFSDKPCGADAREIEVRAPEVSGSGPMVSDQAKRFLQQRDKQAKVRQVDRAIERQEERKAAARDAMDEALIRYQKKKVYANNNLAGAVWESSLADEAEVLRKRFQAEIDAADREIDRLLDERRRIIDSD